MFEFTKNIQPYIQAELQLAKQARSEEDSIREFKHLENAHVLGQPSTFYHTKVHCLMLMWGIRQKNSKEIMGQIFRVVGAMTKTVFGLVPEGNTGGSNVSPVKPMPLSAAHLLIISTAKRSR
jgi:hypothetical protein